MDLHSENAFWVLANGLLASYPSLQRDVQADVAIIGAGITGSLVTYIGQSPEYSQTYFALGFGGNGITYSQVAADILCDLITGKPNDDAHIFRFGCKK